MRDVYYYLRAESQPMAPLCGDSRWLAWVAVLGLLLVSGCGRDGPQVVQITGTVTHKGKPLEHIQVGFVPVQGRPSFGYTDQDGKYSLMYTHDRDGAVVGHHKVYVAFEPRDLQTEMAIAEGRYQMDPAVQDVLKKYGDLETTPLSFEITKAAVIDLELD